MPKGTEISDFWRRFTEMIGKPVDVKQKDVLKAAGVIQSAVTKWKTGKGTPSLPRAIELANDHGVCLEWLMTGRGPKYPGDVADADLAGVLEVWPHLTAESKLAVVKYAKYQRTVQTTAPPERIKEVHEQLSEANHKARAAHPPRSRE